MSHTMLSVGDILRREREKKALTFKQVEKGTKIRARYLQAVEENNWEEFTSKVYISGVIRNYAKFLGMDVKKAEAYFRRDYEKKEVMKFKKNEAGKYLTPVTRKIMIAFFASIFIIFFGYFGYQLTLFFSPPKVTVIQPTQTTFRNVERIEIIGQTEKEASITIFGQRVFPNKEGQFTYDFPLQRGRNELVIEVVGGNGKKTVLKQEYILE